MNIWDLEYTKYNKIPSSKTYRPSSSLREFLNKYKFENAKILDIGCGNGRNSIYCLNNGFNKAVGVDISSVAVDIAKKYSGELGLDLKAKYYTHSLDTKLPEKDYSFDLILDMTTSHLFNDIQYTNYIKEIQRLIKSNGYILIYTIVDSMIDGKRIDKVEIDNDIFIQYYFRDISKDIENTKLEIIEKEIYQANRIINNISYSRKYMRLVIHSK